MLPSAEQEQTLQSLKMMNESMGLYGNLSLETILELCDKTCWFSTLFRPQKVSHEYLFLPQWQSSMRVN